MHRNSKAGRQEMTMIPTRGLVAALAALAAFVAFALPRPLGAESAPSFSSEQKTAIGDMIRDYIMAHPEIVQDALLELDKRQKEAESAAVKSALTTESKSIYDTSAGAVVGNPAGDVTLVEFFDYNCP